MQLAPNTGQFPDLPRPLGPYLLVHRLAKGGMGEVYLAKHKGFADIEKYVVVKTMRSRYTTDAEYVARFVDEARIVVQLSHRNICQVFDVGKLARQYYLAMELVNGIDVRTLEARAREQRRPLSEAAALHLVGEVLEALDYAHRHAHPLSGEPLNLVHRDVSPQNVMVNFEGEVKLIDFGLARSRMRREQTNPEVVLGKLAYMSREQLHGEPLDGRSDQFSAAVMLYELLVGERYYEGMSQSDIWDAVSAGTHVPRRFDALPEGLRPILRRALSRDREERYPTCAALKDDLEAYDRAQGTGASARDLRQRMEELFASERQALRDLLRGFAEVTSAPELPMEPTESIARGALPGAAPLGAAQLLEVPLPPHAATERMPARPQPSAARPSPARPSRRRQLALGGAAAVGLVVGLGVWLRPEDAPSQALVAVEAAAAPALPPAPEAAPSGATVGSAVVAKPVAAAGADEALVSAGASPQAPAIAGSATGLAPEEASLPIAPSAAEAPARDRKGAERRRVKKPARAAPARLKRRATSAEKLDFLQRHCRQRTRCAAPLVGDRRRLEGMEIAEVARFWRRVRACLEECQR